MHGKRAVVLTLFIVVIFGLSIFGLVDTEPLSVSPWTSPPLTPGDMVALTAELDTLGEILADTTLGSQRAEGRRGWDSLAFAQYSGAVLASLGYTVQLVTDSHWLGGSHSWILVNLAPSGMSPAWVPVETVPLLGSPQDTLGMVPTQSISSTEIVFDSRYNSFESASELASNRAPTANIFILGSKFLLNEHSVISALGSRDYDGDIVIYRWQVGDAEWFATRSWSTTITPMTPGSTSITLQVIDNQGASATVSVQVEITERPDELPSPPDCGCSK